MKKGTWKKGLAFALAAVMTLGLGACGGKGGDDNGQLAKENVYSFQEIVPVSDQENISGLTYRDGRLYMLVTQYEYDEEGNGKETFGYYSFNTDGSDKNFVELVRSEREESYSYMNSTLFADGETIYGVENSIFEDYSDPDNSIYEDRYYLSCWDMEGKLLWSERIDNADPEGYTYCNYLLNGGEGRALAIMGGSKYEAVVYGPDGKEVIRRELDQNLFERTNGVFTRSDGTLMVMSYNDDWTKFYMQSYDIESGNTGEQTEITFSNNFSVYQGVNSDLLLTNGMGVYTWNVGDAEPKMLMSYVNSDLPTNNVRYVQIVDDQHFAAVYNDINNWETKLGYFTYVDPADIPDREVLVLGGEYFSSDLKSRVIDFNKTNDRYRITLKDYSIYNTNDDWNAGHTRLNNDITSGQMPDIMVMNDISSYSNYVSKGVLADVGKLLEADEELGKLEYLQNVRDAFSIGGKLYAVVPSFNVRTMIAKKSLVGEPEVWTMADVEAVLATMPEGATAFGDMMRDSYLFYVMSYAGQDFVDLETGKCNFNSQSFIEMLEYAKTLPTEYPEDYWENYDYSSYQSQYRENRSLLCDMYMSNIQDAKMTIKGLMGEEITFVGFPTAQGGGSTLSAGNYTFVLSARSKHLDGAWAFVRQFLTPEYQSSDELYDMPVLKSAFLERAKKATERPYWTDEDGNKEYYDDTWYINGEDIVLEPFTQEEVDEICEFIYSVNRTPYYNEDITNIITEEAAAFFEGQKSVQDVVDIIQSRAQVFVNENR